MNATSALPSTSDAGSAAIRVFRLTYAYPGQMALSDVSFEIRRGAITALVGPNGAGKSTLLKCLAALLRPYRGSININGVDVIRRPRDAHRMIGFLPDFFGLYDALTVTRALTYFAWSHRMDRERVPDRVAEVLRMIDLSEKAGEKVASLSRGMRQRLAIGQAIVHDPEVLLLDEPASGLDPEARQRLSNLLVDLNRAGKTIVVSSHILSELDQYATDLMIIRNGRVVTGAGTGAAAGPTRTLIVEMLSPPGDLSAIRSAFPEIGSAREAGTMVEIAFSGDEGRQHALLRALLEAGFPVTAFHARRESLQTRYMESLSGSKPATEPKPEPRTESQSEKGASS